MMRAADLDKLAARLLMLPGACERHGRTRFPCRECGALASFDAATGAWDCCCGRSGDADDLVALVAAHEAEGVDDAAAASRPSIVVSVEPLVFFADDLAVMLRLSPSTARRWLAEGRLGRTVRIGKRNAIRAETLRATLAAWEDG